MSNPNRLSLLAFVLASLAIAASCASANDSLSPSAVGGGDAASGSTTPSTPGEAGLRTDASESPDAPAIPDASRPDIDASAFANAKCGSTPPSGAPEPPPLPAYSGGTCPALVAGTNTITSSASARQFILVLPSQYGKGSTPPAPLPLFVMWHYIGGDAEGMVKNAQAQSSADALNVIIAVPNKKGDVALPFYSGVDFAWPYLTTSSDARVAEEVTFFDDMVTCVSAQYPIDQSCISTVGVSAGALWVSQLAQSRSERLASALVISGGIGPALPIAQGVVDVRGWNGMPRPIPMAIGWGGPMDQCGVDFDTASHNLETAVKPGGNFVVECIHNCGHAVPPVDPTTGLKDLYQFALDHPYWLPPGASPYLATGLPPNTPSWCGIGIGSAVMRTGACPSSNVSCPPL
ncbi:MAG TPA: hypothetical protein VMI75_02000 [Polyangiaceae bacterium]|nr:hypothetical protein [Polyangiaceae bacterium]